MNVSTDSTSNTFLAKFHCNCSEIDTMLEFFNRRTVLFYTARCHGDLTWYLSMNTLTAAANDNGVAYIRARRTANPRGRLRLLTMPTK
jgi:hypothetical protein